MYMPVRFWIPGAILPLKPKFLLKTEDLEELLFPVVPAPEYMKPRN
jgi:hypothetical protein